MTTSTISDKLVMRSSPCPEGRSWFRSGRRRQDCDGTHRRSIAGGQAPDQAKAPTGPGPATTSGQVHSKTPSQSGLGSRSRSPAHSPAAITRLRGGFSQSGLVVSVGQLHGSAITPGGSRRTLGALSGSAPLATGDHARPALVHGQALGGPI